MNIGYILTEEQLQRYFSQYGSVLDVYLPRQVLTLRMLHLLARALLFCCHIGPSAGAGIKADATKALGVPNWCLTPVLHTYDAMHQLLMLPCLVPLLFQRCSRLRAGCGSMTLRRPQVHHLRNRGGA